MREKMPKIIHYCWFGGGEKPEIVKKCISSWEKYCPDYKIIEWNETNFDIRMNTFVYEAHKKQKWAFVSDYCRLWAVYRYGGIYLDTDVEIIKNIDEVLSDQVFFCFENESYVNTGLGFGAVKNADIVGKMMNRYDKMDESNLMPCPVLNTEFLKKYLDDDNFAEKDATVKNIRLYSTEYFCPLDYDTHELNITKNTYAVHWYGESWLSGKKKITKKIKRFAAKVLGASRYRRIKRRIRMNA